MKHYWQNYFNKDEIRVILFFLFFLGLGFILKIAGFYTEKTGNLITPTEFTQDYEIKYDLRSVTQRELETIPGIGPKRASDIIKYQTEHGFNSKIDLLNVKGIGKATLSKIEKYFLDFGVEFNLNNTSQKSSNNNALGTQIRININRAGIEELVELPGIGPSKAEKIINLRKQLGKFKEVDDILQVKGIGPKTLGKFRDKICTGGDDE